MGNNSDFLFARPSFLEGLARVADIAGGLNVYNSSTSPEQADRVALSRDMRAVSEDYWEAIERIEQKLKASKRR